MTTVTDDFAGTGAVSANWTIANGVVVLARSGGQLVVSSGGGNGGTQMFWNANTFSGDQTAQITVKQLPSGGNYGMGPMVKYVSNVTPDSYYTIYQSGLMITYKDAGGVQTQIIVQSSPTVAVNDVLALTAVASGPNLIITAYQNGSVVGTPYTDSSTPLTGTHVGITTRNFDSNSIVDDFSGGDYSAGGGSVSDSPRRAFPFSILQH